MARLALLINPTSGKGRGLEVAARAAQPLRDAGFTVERVIGHDADHATDLLRAALADGVETFGVVGGDGMVHLAAQALAGTQATLGIIPAGTGNDAARALGIPLKDAAKAAETIIGGRVREIDLAQVGERYFVTVLAAGFDAIVTERGNAMTWPRGQARYNLATLVELRGLQARPYLLDIDGTTHRFEAIGVAVGNTATYGGGMQICAGAVPDDSLLDVVVIGAINRRELLRTFPKLFKGTHLQHPQVTVLRGARVTVAAPGIVGYADGERIGALPLTVSVAPRALRVLAP